MATIKSFSDLEQSKKLAKILPITSIDFAWCIFSNGSTRLLPMDDWEVSEYAKSNVEIIPCWSLAALLNILPTLDGRNAVFCKDISNDRWHIFYHSTATLSIIDTERYDNLIDTCYEMIIKLHKLNLL